MTVPPSSYSRTGRLRRAAFILMGIAACALLGGRATAGQLQIMPTRLGLTGAAPTTTLFATNADDQDASYQLTLFNWSQQTDGSDQLDPTREVLANPGIFTIKPGEQQVVRFGLRSDPLSVERSYRVILQELPRPNQQYTGIRTLLRVSVPIFVPAANPTTVMRWALRSAPGGVQLLARNAGNVHVQVTGVQISDGRGQQTAMKCSIYVLPGISRVIDVRAPKPLAAGVIYHVRIDTDQGPMTADLRNDPAATLAAN